MSRTLPSASLGLLDSIPEVWRAAATLAAVFAIAFTFAITATDWHALPLRLRSAEARLASHDTSLSRLTHAVDALQGTARAQLCLSVAERARTDWRACFLPDGSTAPAIPQGVAR